LLTTVPVISIYSLTSYGSRVFAVEEDRMRALRNTHRSSAGCLNNGAFELLNLSSRYISQVGIIAGLYAALTVVLAPISYGPIQLRVSEALTVLPYLTPAAVPGLFIGCLVANIFGGLGIYDVVGGSLLTLLAAFLTHLMARTRRPILAPLPPVLVNSLGVSLYLHLLFQLPYWLTVIYIGIGEMATCFILGYPLLLIILRKKKLLEIFKL
jgi:uncharacterized membrane protein